MRTHFVSTLLSKLLRLALPASILVFCGALATSPAKADTCGSSAGNTVQNCGFETGDFSHWILSGNLQGGTPPNNYYGVDGSQPNSGSSAGYFGVQGGGGTSVGQLGPFLE